MRTYMIEIALIESAAKLTGKNINNQYAVLGTLKRFRKKKLGEVHNIKGMEDLTKRAESFRFGALCQEHLIPYIDSLSQKEILAWEAKTAGLFLLPGMSEEAELAEKEETLNKVLKAYVKRAQIRTHTAKPGSEDINAWLENYDMMQMEYQSELGNFVKAVLDPDPDMKKKGNEFINEEDGLVKALLDGDRESQWHALFTEPKCVFGIVLRRIVKESMPS